MTTQQRRAARAERFLRNRCLREQEHAILGYMLAAAVAFGALAWGILCLVA